MRRGGKRRGERGAAADDDRRAGAAMLPQAAICLSNNRRQHSCHSYAGNGRGGRADTDVPPDGGTVHPAGAGRAACFERTVFRHRGAVVRILAGAEYAALCRPNTEGVLSERRKPCAGLHAGYCQPGAAERIPAFRLRTGGAVADLRIF